MVIEAKNLCYIVEIWMLDNERPERIVHPVVEIHYCDLHSPILLVVDLDVPVDSNWAHVVCALEKRSGVVCYVFRIHQLKNFRITAA